jgi:KDO2-lipid IV(A) lauroyltransferase
MLRELRHRAVDIGFAAGWGAIKYAPEPLARRVFDVTAMIAAKRGGEGTQQLRKNLRRVVGPEVAEEALDDLVARALRSYARYWLETFRLPRMDAAKVAAVVEANTEGTVYLEDALAAGNGAVLALAHQGNWDVGGVWLVSRCGTFITVAERLKPESLFERFLAYRESLGFEVLALSGGDQAPVGLLSERLKQNKVACLVADRDMSHSGVEVTFFGEPTRMPPGPALLAVQTGAALLPVILWFTEDGGWAQQIHPPIPVPEIEGAGRLRKQVQQMTQQLAECFEKGIAEHPADWHMLQPFWPADLPSGTGAHEQ